MNNRVAIFYLTSTAVYFGIGTGHIYWAGFNMVTLLLSLLYFMGNTGRVGAWVRLARNVTAYRIIYTVLCIVWPVQLIYPTNKILSIILLVAITITWIRHSRK